MDNDYVDMINVRGRVVRARKWEMPLLKQQGMRLIFNPKQEYYPEYDIENPRVVKMPDISKTEIEKGEVLIVEKI